ncbi:hypothetical protein I7I48_08916 [Histoplasma ohiense]|nr:hypothetical protein I7I48_08916 [Histoplasma ohiense (nom. inval.)]
MELDTTILSAWLNAIPIWYSMSDRKEMKVKSILTFLSGTIAENIDITPCPVTNHHKLPSHTGKQPVVYSNRRAPSQTNSHGKSCTSPPGPWHPWYPSHEKGPDT